MKKYVDLHMHSTFSDGERTREQLIEEAKQAGLSLISITDHDTCKAYFDFDLEGHGIEILKGVEIITTAGKCPVEVLIYGFDERDCEKFLRENSLSHAEESKVKTNKEIAVLKSLGINVALDTEHFDYDNPKNWSVAALWQKLMLDPKAKKLLADENPELLVSAKLFFRKGMANIRSKFFVDLSTEYVSLKKLREYCDKNNLVMILAHPGEYYTNIDIVLEDAKNYVDGIETYHPSINSKLKAYLQDYCKKYNLLESGGSDYHGFRGALNSEKVPYHIYEKIADKLAVLRK